MPTSSTPPASSGENAARPHVASADASQRSRAVRLGSASDALEQLSAAVSALHRVGPLGPLDLARLWVLADELVTLGGVRLVEAMAPGTWLGKFFLGDVAKVRALIALLKGRSETATVAARKGA